MPDFKSAPLQLSVSAQSASINTNIKFFSQDFGSAKLLFTVFKDSKAMDLTGATAKLTFLMADKSTFQVDATIDDAVNGAVSYVLLSDILQHHGKATGELDIYYGTTQGLSVGQFQFVINASLSDQDNQPVTTYYIESIEALKTDMTAQLQTVNDEIAQANTDIESIQNLITQNQVVSGTDFNTFKDSTNEQLAEKANQIKLSPDMIAIGDSTMRGDDVAGGCIPLWLGHLLKKTVINKGVWGNWMSDVRARLQTDVINLRPRYCVILVGTNDINGGRALGDILVDAEYIADTLLTNRIEPIFVSVAPRADFPAVLPTIRKYNAMLMVRCQQRMIKFVDIYNPLSNSDGTSLANIHVADNLHWATYGAVLASKEIAKAFMTPSLYNNQGDRSVFKGDYPAYDNNLFTAGTTLATYWTALDTTNTTFSLVANPNGGNYQVINKTATTALTSGIYSTAGALNLLAYYRMEFDLDFDITDKTDTNVRLVASIEFLNASSAVISSVNVLDVYAKKIDLTTVFKDFQVPTGTVSTKFSIWANGASPFTIKVGRVYCYNSL